MKLVFPLVILSYQCFDVYFISLELVILSRLLFLSLLKSLELTRLRRFELIFNSTADQVKYPFVLTGYPEKSFLKLFEVESNQILLQEYFSLGETFEGVYDIVAADYERTELEVQKEVSPGFIDDLMVVIFLGEGVMSVSDKKLEDCS